MRTVNQMLGPARWPHFHHPSMNHIVGGNDLVPPKRRITDCAHVSPPPNGAFAPRADRPRFRPHRSIRRWRANISCSTALRDKSESLINTLRFGWTSTLREVLDGSRRRIRSSAARSSPFALLYQNIRPCRPEPQFHQDNLRSTFDKTYTKIGARLKPLTERSAKGTTILRSAAWVLPPPSGQ